ncbi:MAG: pyridoxal phosphate-dependent aminotransferase [Deltaproteobacteria bacterium]|nr:pyridoxal phosphate-dependent aminotransferase [Deltaproteobacteria bacterium]
MEKDSKRSRQIKSFIAMEVLEKSQEMEKAGEDVISLSIGEPDLPAPKVVKQAAIEAIRRDFTKYTHSQGLIEFREAVCEFYHKKHHVKVHPDQVFVTSGSSPAFLLAFASILDNKEEIIVSDPCYPCYPNFINFLEGKAKFLPVYEKNQFQYDPDELKKKITKKTKGILVTSPGNPTGYLLPAKTYEALANLGPYLISDEIYQGLVYEGVERSALEFTDQAFVLNGFSKSYSMTGFRLGYLIAPKKLCKAIARMSQNLYISVSSFIQLAGLAALKEGQKDQLKMREIFRARRQVALEELAKIGLSPTHIPQGAFYIFINVKKYTQDSYKFAFDCLKKAKVGITPGIDFGRHGEGYIRISYANSIANIREGIRRLGKFIEGL